jgi:hypothetical protein
MHNNKKRMAENHNPVPIHKPIPIYKSIPVNKKCSYCGKIYCSKYTTCSENCYFAKKMSYNSNGGLTQGQWLMHGYPLGN